MGTRQLLAYLTDTSPYGDPAVWREWAGSNPAPKLGALPPPRTDLDAEFAPQ
jgi:hypothetical protein